MRLSPLNIDARMIAAVSTLRRLPDPMVQQFGSSWPDVVRESIESYGYDKPTKVKAASSARATSFAAPGSAVPDDRIGQRKCRCERARQLCMWRNSNCSWNF